MSDQQPHTGPVKTPQQFLLTGILSLVVPIFLIIGLVMFVVYAPRTDSSSVDADVARAQRIQKVGVVALKDANRAVRTGEEVYKAQCTACHATGLAGAPKFGDSAAWAPRLPSGLDTLLHSALKGKGSMGAQGGGDFSDYEIARAVVYMTHAAGGKFPEPLAPAKEGEPAKQ